jgi:hypothetical protein
MSAEKPVWHSNVASGDITFDELAQAAYEAHSRRLWGERATSWGALMDYEQVAWRQAVQVVHRMIVKRDQKGEPHAQ